MIPVFAARSTEEMVDYVRNRADQYVFISLEGLDFGAIDNLESAEGIPAPVPEAITPAFINEHLLFQRNAVGQKEGLVAKLYSNDVTCSHANGQSLQQTWNTIRTYQNIHREDYNTVRVYTISRHA